MTKAERAAYELGIRKARDEVLRVLKGVAEAPEATADMSMMAILLGIIFGSIDADWLEDD